MAPTHWNHFISVVVYHAENNQAALKKTLNSLLHQTYRNIEVIVFGNDLPRDCRQDDFMTLRGLITRPDLNANSFLKSKHYDSFYRGDYLLFAPAGTIFYSNCFELAVDAINNYTEQFPDLAIFDYDCIASSQTTSERVFLPGWDPEFALSTDSYRTAFLSSRKLVERVRSKYVLPNLDSWISSVAKLHPQPEHAHISEPAIHFTKDEQLDQSLPRLHRVERPAGSNPTVSLIIPNRNRPDLLKSCLAMLDHIQGLDLDLIIVDNNSEDAETLDLYKGLKSRIGAKIIDAGAMFNYSRMVNIGVQESQSDFIALINNDVEFTIPGEFENLVYHAMRPEVGIVGARLFYPSGRIQHAGIVIDTGVMGNMGSEFRCRHVLRGCEKSESDPRFPQNADRSFMAVTGAVQVMKRDVFNSLGGYDEVYLPIEYNDIDFCLRAKIEEYRVLCVALEGVFHRESESRGKEDSPETRRMREKAIKVMLSRWSEFVENKPYGHPAIEVGDCPKPVVMSNPKS
ncbi:glycosyltransferase [Ruegeria sp. HKCCA4633]|uniref:glycosyltransferase family 2 protein n=1 Tax=Ruegeria sp. HKCCA4633 TaxID=2682983 RepID=UPI001488CA50|nr:glycosyltransferase [Ruegeria sp. HKCCA4633]